MSEPFKSRILAIADIHGHTAGLQLLLGLAKYNPLLDQLILLGDYVEPNPSTWDALSFVQRLVNEGAWAIIGNQEQKLLSKFSFLHKYNIWKSWLKKLPYYIEVPPYLFVHAGIRPDVPLHQQSVADLTEIREPFFQSRLTTEYTVVFGHTPTHKLGVEPGGIWIEKGRIGIDTGAKHGYRLTLLDLTGGISYSCSTEEQDLYRDIQVRKIDLK